MHCFFCVYFSHGANVPSHNLLLCQLSVVHNPRLSFSVSANLLQSRIYTCILKWACCHGYVVVGELCEAEIDKCSSGPCGNNSTCLDRLGYFRCDCLPPYMYVRLRFSIFLGSGGSSISQKGLQSQRGANLLFDQIFAENCMKMNKNWLRACPSRPLDPPMLEYLTRCILRPTASMSLEDKVASRTVVPIYTTQKRTRKRKIPLVFAANLMNNTLNISNNLSKAMSLFRSRSLMCTGSSEWCIIKLQSKTITHVF